MLTCINKMTVGKQKSLFHREKNRVREAAPQVRGDTVFSGIRNERKSENFGASRALENGTSHWFRTALKRS